MDIKLESEFTKVLERHKNIIHKICYIYSNSHNSPQDLFQEVVINLWNAYPRFRGQCQIQTWIYRIALNTCITFLRKNRSRPQTSTLLWALEIPGEESSDSNIKELYEVIARLNEIEKALLMLYLEEKSQDEIAHITGISRSNVGVKLFRIKNKLKTMLNN